MKRKIKISTLIFGIIIAVLAFTSSSLYADPVEKKDVVELKTLRTEMYSFLEQMFEKKPMSTNRSKCMKIYNENKKLVYECRDKNDERLKVLLRRSDLILETNTSSYYLLND